MPRQGRATAIYGDCPGIIHTLNVSLRRRFTDEAARERKKLDSEVVETVEMKTKRLEKAVREETIKEQVQVRFIAALSGKHGFGCEVALLLDKLRVFWCAATRRVSLETRT